MSKPSDKKGTNHHDSDLYWPKLIKYTISWFTFLTIMKHTTNILNPNKGLTPSLLKVFAIFEFLLIDCGDKVDAIAIRCINGNKEIFSYLGTSTLE